MEKFHAPDETLELGKDLAALTHGHPSGALAAGVLAVLISGLCDGVSLTEALTVAKELLRKEPHHEETLRAIELSEQLYTAGLPHADAIARIGQGWIAEEALAISVYCALVPAISGTVSFWARCMGREVSLGNGWTLWNCGMSSPRWPWTCMFSAIGM